MNKEDVQHARAWLHEHPPHTFEAMDTDTRRLYRHNMDIIKADLAAWFQRVNPQGYTALLAEVWHPDMSAPF